MIDVKKLYDTRFNQYERIRRKLLWQVLCHDFIQKFVKESDVVVDVGAGQCEFINNINCRKKIAVDINKDIKKYADRKVKVIISSVKHLKNLFPKESIDVIFMSNLLEHLDSKEEVFRLLLEANYVLKKKGRLLLMQPDISLVVNSYWDFFDHKVPLTYASITEVLLADKYIIHTVVHPFLPYSTKIRFLPLWPLLLKTYLKIRPLHYIFGKQFFICAEK